MVSHFFNRLASHFKTLLQLLNKLRLLNSQCFVFFAIWFYFLSPLASTEHRRCTYFIHGSGVFFFSIRHFIFNIYVREWIMDFSIDSKLASANMPILYDIVVCGVWKIMKWNCYSPYIFCWNEKIKWIKRLTRFVTNIVFAFLVHSSFRSSVVVCALFFYFFFFALQILCFANRIHIHIRTHLGRADKLRCHLRSEQTELKPYKNLKRALACL